MKARIITLLTGIALLCGGRTLATNVGVDFVDATGGSVSRNVDDDDEDEEWDKDQGAMPVEDDDLKQFKVTTSIKDGVLSISVEEGASRIKFWADRKKEREHGMSWTVANDKIQGTATAPASDDGKEGYFYVEGLETSDSWNDVKVKATISGHEDTVEFSVIEVDLDVDSNNNEKAEFSEGSEEEDKIEASTKPDGEWSKRPGKLLMVNDGFGDDIPDWADGFISDVSNPDCYTCGPPITFVPMLLERKKPFTDQCTVKFTYSASNPSDVQAVGGRGFPNYDKHFTKPAGKMIRIWKKNNDGTNRIAASIVSGGDYVPDAVEIQWDKLSDGAVAKLWVEAVEPSAGLADISVKTEMTEDGATATDEVKFTAINITCEPITAELSSGLRPYNSSGLVAFEGAQYKIDVKPSDYPDSEIKWRMSGLSGVLSPNTGREVGLITNTWSTGGYVFCDVLGNYYDSPKIPVNSYYNKIQIKLNVYAVPTSSGTSPSPVISQADVLTAVNKANEIHAQSGIEFVVQSYTSLPASYYSYLDCTTEEAYLITDYVSGLQGLEVYFVASSPDWDGVNIPGAAANKYKGIVITASGHTFDRLGFLVAHETGHSCGLKDIYTEKGGVTFGVWKAWHSWNAMDWPSSSSFASDPSYYKRLEIGYETATRPNRMGWYPSLEEDLSAYSARQDDLIWRLLMNGSFAYAQDLQKDIPCGHVRGVRNGFYIGDPNVIDNVNVGLDGIDRFPNHE